MLHLIKIILVIFSVYLSYMQFKNNHNKQLGSYWVTVALYWFINFLQGIL